MSELEIQNRFKYGNYPIFYPFVITQALRHWIVEGNKSKDDAQKVLFRLSNFLYHLEKGLPEKNYFKEPHFLEVFNFKYNYTEFGCVVVDRSNGCQPLILYPPPQPGDKKGPRITAFLASVDNLYVKRNNFFSLLFSSLDSHWSTLNKITIFVSDIKNKSA